MGSDFLDTPLGVYARRLAELEGQEPRIFKIVLDVPQIKELIVRLNTEDQLGEKHVDAKGQALFSKINKRGVYSRLTERITAGFKKAGTQYNLNLTGEFWDSFRVVITEDEICILANPTKEDTDLFIEYGPDIVGLTDSNLEILQDEVLILFQKFLSQWLLLGNR